jgi:hypothetical protein
VAELSRANEDEAFITGNGIAARCRHVLNYQELTVNDGVDNDWWFCKADFLEYFFSELAPDDGFVLFSHNSDRRIGRRFRRELRRRRLVAWFAQNPALVHPKLRALPIGVANPTWPIGDTTVFRRVQATPPPKTELFDVSFVVDTNPDERTYCLEQTGLRLAPRRPFPEHVRRLASAYFCISPRGNGIDTHRTWEALYLRTIPVVTRSLVTEHHPDVPMIVLNDWSEFGSVRFSPELYRHTWGEWGPEELGLDSYLRGVEEAVRELRT